MLLLTSLLLPASLLLPHTSLLLLASLLLHCCKLLLLRSVLLLLPLLLSTLLLPPFLLRIRFCFQRLCCCCRLCTHTSLLYMAFLHAVVCFSFFACVLDAVFAVVCVVTCVRDVAGVAIMLLLAFVLLLVFVLLLTFQLLIAFLLLLASLLILASCDPGIPYTNIQGIPLEFLGITAQNPADFQGIPGIHCRIKFRFPRNVKKSLPWTP
jgi:hypothetical protein